MANAKKRSGECWLLTVIPMEINVGESHLLPKKSLNPKSSCPDLQRLVFRQNGGCRQHQPGHPVIGLIYHVRRGMEFGALEILAESRV